MEGIRKERETYYCYYIILSYFYLTGRQAYGLSPRYSTGRKVKLAKGKDSAHLPCIRKTSPTVSRGQERGGEYEG